MASIESIKTYQNKLSDNEITAQGLVFLTAGYETTAWTLTYCSYELALNPDVQRRLYDEVLAAIDPNTGHIEYEVLTQMPYLEAVVAETLRLYPPITRLPRCCVKNYTLGDTGIKFDPGQRIEIPVYGIHHSEEFYPNAEKFDPTRFMAESGHQILPYTYLPFGAGPRSCIAMRFALMETKLALTQMVRRYIFERTPQTPVPLKFDKLSFFCAAKQVLIGIKVR